MRKRKNIPSAMLAAGLLCITLGVIHHRQPAEPTAVQLAAVPAVTAPAAEIVEEQSPAEPAEEQQTETPAAPALSLGLPAELESKIDQAADRYGLDPALVRGVIWVESRGVTTADNGTCAGLMQLHKGYAETFQAGAGVENITDPANNVEAGCWYLAELMTWAEGEEALALMAYNLGNTKAGEWWSEGVRATRYTEAVETAKGGF